MQARIAAMNAVMFSIGIGVTPFGTAVVHMHASKVAPLNDLA
jgi:hypothetical protein